MDQLDFDGDRVPLQSLRDPREPETAGVRQGDPETSAMAARLIEPRAGSLRWEIILALSRVLDDGATVGELHRALERSQRNVIASRVSELARAGWVESRGEPRPQTRIDRDTEAAAIVWHLTPHARGHLRQRQLFDHAREGHDA